MKRNFKFIVAAIAAVAMVGCAKDGGDKIATPDNGTETIASFRITFPKGGTRAMDDAATDEESTIKDAEVFLFDDATKTLESRTVMTLGSGTPVTSATATVTTFTGKHYVYVLVNKPASLNLADVVAPTSTDPGTPMADFLKKVIDAETKLPAEDDEFMMTAYAEPTFIAPTIDTPSPDANNVKMGLGRAVAKVHMADAVVSYPENTDEVADLKYKVMNNPNTMRAFQQYSMSLVSGAITNSGTIVNEIVGDGSATPRTNYYHRLPDNNSGTGYEDASNTAKAGLYVPENWNTNPAPTTHNATSLIVQGTVMLEDGMEIRKADGTATTVNGIDDVYEAGDTFYRVWDKQANKWLPFFFCEEPGAAGANMDVLLGAAGQNPANTTGKISEKRYTMEDPGTDYEFFIAEYKDALAYWRLPLRNDELSKSVVARNDYFWVTIKTIAEIGASTDSDDPDDDGILPKDPEPLDKTEVDITATIEVLKWHGVEQEGHI